LNKQTGEIVAIKIIDIESTEDDLAEIQQEVVFQSKCDDPYITKYFGSWLKGTFNQLSKFFFLSFFLHNVKIKVLSYG